ncbi:MAG: ferredoxin [Zetaproteobacteria bacterium CG2_30_46_52]|nr:MAG: ferredoxin [Zetaproteobacteria bacterium CG2_30_46_52]
MSDASKKPEIAPYQRHAILCVGKSCGENMPLLKFGKTRLAELGLDHGEHAVRLNRAGCLGVCEQGPIMVVYPEGVWYCGLDESGLDEIIQDHLRDGRPVERLVMHTMKQERS